MAVRIRAREYRALQRGDIDRMGQLAGLSVEQRLEMKAVAAVLPFRVNEYVAEELVDWSKLPDDPIYQLTFPQPGMLSREAFDTMLRLVRKGAPESELRTQARRIQLTLNPHPAGQIELNVPRLSGRSLRGLQHKYRETVLFFPSQGQTCHAYCAHFAHRDRSFHGIAITRSAASRSERSDVRVARGSGPPCRDKGSVPVGSRPLNPARACRRHLLASLSLPGFRRDGPLSAMR